MCEQRSKIKSRIAVNVKTLHGERKTHKVSVSIIDLVSKVKDKLAELQPEEMKMYQNAKLFNPHDNMKLLPLNQTVESALIKDNSTLILMGIQAFSLDQKNKDPSLKVSSVVFVNLTNQILNRYQNKILKPLLPLM